MSRVDQKNRDKALEIIKQWMKDEEERIKMMEVAKCTKKMNNNTPGVNKLETIKNALKVTDAAKAKGKVIDYILKRIIK